MKFQGWMGLIIGPIVGAAAHLKFARRSGDPMSPGMLITFAVVGLVAGAILWAVDAARSKRP